MSECELDEYGTYCSTHKCGAYEANCNQDNCPHCSFLKPKYDESRMEEVNRTVLAQLSDGLLERDCA